MGDGWAITVDLPATRKAADVIKNRDYWRSVGREGMDTYAAGSWGPASADAILAKNDHVWRQP